MVGAGVGRLLVPSAGSPALHICKLLCGCAGIVWCVRAPRWVSCAGVYCLHVRVDAGWITVYAGLFVGFLAERAPPWQAQTLTAASVKAPRPGVVESITPVVDMIYYFEGHAHLLAGNNTERISERQWCWQSSGSWVCL